MKRQLIRRLHLRSTKVLSTSLKYQLNANFKAGLRLTSAENPISGGKNPFRIRLNLTIPITNDGEIWIIHEV